MALKVWLPLNKDLRSVGLSNVTVINSGATLDNNGIIGKCYSIPLGKYIGLDAKNVNNHKYSPISIALWVYPTQNDSTSRSVFGCWENGGGGFYLKSQKIGFNFFIGGTYQSCEMPSTLSLNTWHHICGTYDEKVMRLYIDGVEVATTYVSGKITYNSTCPWEIGGNPGATAFAAGNFVGKLNDIRIYDHCLTEYDIKRLSKQKIFEFQPYNMLSNNLLFDKSGYVLKDFINSQAKFNRNSIYFNGTNQIIRSKEIGFEISGGTLSVWFLPKTRPSGNGTIFYLDGNGRMACGLYNNAANFIVSTKTSSPMFPATGVTYGEWNHVCITYGTNFVATNCYLNGVKLTGSGSNNWSETDSYVKIGGRESYDSFFDGSVANVEVYSKQLSEEECIDIYNTKKLELFLPDEYEELEYIQSNGTQYIDTKIGGFNDGDWEIYCEWMSIAAPAQSYGFIFGVYEGENYNSYRLIHKTTSTTEYYVSAKSKAGGGSILISNITLNEKHNIIIKNGTFICDGISYVASTTGTALPSANTMFLFKSQKSDIFSKCRIYSTWGKKDGILKYNMVPSKRKSDNVIGMYDMVSRQFFTNSGTGSFTGA